MLSAAMMAAAQAASRQHDVRVLDSNEALAGRDVQPFDCSLCCLLVVSAWAAWGYETGATAE